ncbi:hypothetical protein RvY_02715 [Ramazzottius varieornatus]|uniref:Uncharacterized protein n=1 Tax=Ramazzottius varieornatus TaxID=947166 RepID=A0A1D1USR8_RAMVA|nr:hypothetical protein RvY_02715 [Ramazzottius varieornatus]
MSESTKGSQRITMDAPTKRLKSELSETHYSTATARWDKLNYDIVLHIFRSSLHRPTLEYRG